MKAQLDSNDHEKLISIERIHALKINPLYPAIGLFPSRRILLCRDLMKNEKNTPISDHNLIKQR